MTLDANIIIAYLAGDQAVAELLSQLRRDGKTLFLPTVAETEVLSFSPWTKAEWQATESFLEQNFASIPFDRTVARITADIRRKTKIKFPDAAIAATAIFTNTPVLTINKRDFRKIAKVTNLEVYTV